MTQNGLLAPLVDAVAALDPQPRERQWVSLTFCVLDAVYSIGANYDHHVVPVVRRVATDFGVDTPAATPAAATSMADPVPLSALINRYADPDALIVVTGRTRPRVAESARQMRFSAMPKSSINMAWPHWQTVAPHCPTISGWS